PSFLLTGTAGAFMSRAMLFSDFDFDLPEARIALRPMVPREAARLLRIPATGPLIDSHVGDVGDFLRAGDLLVVNDTRVLPVQLRGLRLRDEASVPVEATLIKNLEGTRWQAFLKPGRRVRPEDELRFASEANPDCALQAKVDAKGEDGIYTLIFDCTPQVMIERLHVVGAMPL